MITFSAQAFNPLHRGASEARNDPIHVLREMLIVLSNCTGGSNNEKSMLSPELFKLVCNSIDSNNFLLAWIQYSDKSNDTSSWYLLIETCKSVQVQQFYQRPSTVLERRRLANEGMSTHALSSNQIGNFLYNTIDFKNQLGELRSHARTLLIPIAYSFSHTKPLLWTQK